MKKRNLLLLSFLFYFIASNFGQNLIWSDTFTEYSDAQVILKNSKGQILIAGSFGEDSLFVALYDTDGNRLKLIKYLDHFNFSVSLVEQENGNFLLLSYSGKILKINSSLDTVSVAISTNINIRNSFYNKDEIIILDYEKKLVLNSNTFQTISIDSIPANQNKLAFLYLENKECYFDLKDSVIALSIKENSQQTIYNFNNIDSINHITKTFRV